MKPIDMSQKRSQLIQFWLSAEVHMKPDLEKIHCFQDEVIRKGQSNGNEGWKVVWQECTL